MRGQSLEELPWLLAQPRTQSRHILAFFKGYQRLELKSHYSIKKDQARHKVYLVFLVEKAGFAPQPLIAITPGWQTQSPLRLSSAKTKNLTWKPTIPARSSPLFTFYKTKKEDIIVFLFLLVAPRGLEPLFSP